ncbi:hypothetical protein FJTKL_11488 [Diaporthe vaccinii]|uniref:Uncharacterized protein n=1 Tax=Diaporthe vaccinii TaxID=105482 RepID=A0ABR4EGJ9_9PEZI
MYMAAELHHTPHLLGPRARGHTTEASLFPTIPPPFPAREPCPKVTVTCKTLEECLQSRELQHCFPTVFRYPLHYQRASKPPSRPALLRFAHESPSPASVWLASALVHLLGPRGVRIPLISPKSRHQCDTRAEEGTLAKCKNIAQYQHSHLSRTSPDQTIHSPD